MPLEVYDRTISVLKQAVTAAKLGQSEKIDAIRRLDEQARRLEGVVQGPPLDAFIDEERERSPSCGGCDVRGSAPPARNLQLPLFPAS